MTDVYVLDQDFNKLDVVENYTSLIWSERATEYGDFELTMDPDDPAFGSMLLDNLLTIEESDYIMIIENIEVRKTGDDHYAIMSGRSLESILERRTVLFWENYSTSLFDAMLDRVDISLSATAPITQARVPGFVVNRTRPSGVPNTTSEDFNGTGMSVYDIVVEVCEILGICFRIRHASPNRMIFETFQGKNRTWNGDESAVVFSRERDNLAELSYISTNTLRKNFVNVDYGNGGRIQVWEGGQGATNTHLQPTGLDRREMFYDAMHIRNRLQGFPETSIQNLAVSAARQEMRRTNSNTFTFEGGIDPLTPPFYNQDYFLGDFIALEGEYFGVNAVYRVVECVRSYSSNGLSVNPSFQIVV